LVPFEDEDPAYPFCIEGLSGRLLLFEDLKRFRSGDRRFVWPEIKKNEPQLLERKYEKFPNSPKEITAEPNKQVLTHAPKYAFEAALNGFTGLSAVELKTLDQMFVLMWSFHTRFLV
jgi:hypothetical protein